MEQTDGTKDMRKMNETTNSLIVWFRIVMVILFKLMITNLNTIFFSMLNFFKEFFWGKFWFRNKFDPQSLFPTLRLMTSLVCFLLLPKGL